MDDNSDNVLWDVVFFLGYYLLWIGAFLLPLFFMFWFNSPSSNDFREWAGMPQVTVKTVKTVKPKTIPCKILDDEAGTKECKVKLDDGRTITCIVDSRGRSCDWRNAK